MYIEGVMDNKYIFRSKKINDRYYMPLCNLDKTYNRTFLREIILFYYMKYPVFMRVMAFRKRL